MDNSVVTIIIPAIKNSSILDFTVRECLKLITHIKIIIVKLACPILRSILVIVKFFKFH